MSERLSKEEYAAKKQEERQMMNDMANSHLMEIIRDQDAFVSFLDLYSRLGYSTVNSLLIHAQNPEATAIKDFASWKEDGHPVINNEKGIRIYVPTETYVRKDGSVGQNFDIKYYFDVKQTKNGSVKEKEYDLKDVRNSLISGNEEAYEGKSLSDAIDFACEEAGREIDAFTISCAEYAVKKKYHVLPNNFGEDVVSYFKDTADAGAAKNWTREFEKVYRPVVETIDKGLRDREQEASHDNKQREFRDYDR